MEMALKEINDLLGEDVKEPGVLKVVELIQKRSALIKKINQEKWRNKNLEEKILYRKNKFQELEKYYTKYGESDADVTKKYKYQKVYIELVEAVELLKSYTMEKQINIIPQALFDVLNSSPFVDVSEPAVNLSIHALINRLSIDEPLMKLEDIKTKLIQLEKLSK